MAAFAQRLPHVQYLIPPSIDPLSDKNLTLSPPGVMEVLRAAHLIAGREDSHPLVRRMAQDMLRELEAMDHSALRVLLLLRGLTSVHPETTSLGCHSEESRRRRTTKNLVVPTFARDSSLRSK